MDLTLNELEQKLLLKRRSTLDAAVQEGFRSEAARKQALHDLASIYDVLHNCINDGLRSAMKSGAAVDMDLAYPYTLHTYRLKHREHAQLFLGEHDYIAQVEALFVERASILAMPLLPKQLPKRLQPIAEGDKTQLRGHCQCCTREQAVVNGSMAHHGYNIKYGFFNGTCPGHLHAPMEKSRAYSDKVIAEYQGRITHFEELLQALKDGNHRPSLKEKNSKKEVVVTPYEQLSEAQKLQVNAMAEMEFKQNIAGFRFNIQCLNEALKTYHGQELIVIKK